MSTPHDGNLAIHYACESGCDSQELLSGVLSALLNANPQGLEMKNFKGKTPLLLCNAKARQVLMNVLKTRKQNAKTKYDQRSDGYSPSDHALHDREQRHPPPLNAHLLPPLMDNDSDDFDDESLESEQDSTWQTETQAASNRSNRTSGSSNQMGHSHSADDKLGQQVEALTRQNKSQQQTISQLNERLKHLTSKNEETIAQDAKLLCQRILSKAESDSVKYRTQIEQMKVEQEKTKQETSRREKMIIETLMNVRDLLSEKGDKMNLTLFNEDSESITSQDSSTQYVNLSNQIVDALSTVFAHTEKDEAKLRNQVKSLEEKVCNYEVMHKTAQSANQNHQREKDEMIKKLRDSERSLHQLQDEKESVEKSLADVKEKNSSLVVMNRTLQQQIDKKEDAEHFQFNDMDSVQGDDASLSFNVIQQTLEENKTRIESLVKEQEVLKEKNRSLKDTIMMNNEKYLNKVQELGEKYSDLEKVNSDLRKKLRESAAKSEKSRSSLKVSLEGEDELLYEV